MAKVVVLGGCGAVGSVAVKTLASQDMFTSVVIGDMNMDRAQAIIADLGQDKVSAIRLNADDPESIRGAIAGADVVLNCVGPFYKTVKTILKEVIESGINYVDICDDVDVTLEILAMDADAKRSGVSALIGMGSSPGATNLLAKLAHDSLLDETDSIDIFHTHGGEAIEGEGVIAHRFHCMSIDIPMFLNGSLTYVKYFEDDGKALRQTFDFPVVGKNIPLYPYPHPEQVTLPRYLQLKQVTNKGSVLPNEYYNLTRDLCGLGLASRETLEVKGTSIVPYDFAVAYILKERERILKETGFDTPRGCCSVVAKGRKDGEYKEYRFHMASRSQALGEGTGIPAAMGVILMQQGKVSGPGVLPPEACVDPMEFVSLISKVMKLDEKKEDGDSFGGVIVESVDETGAVTKLDI
ncbi:MAG TPA: saccharopine dehydrogenase NADP-binding domain-containing protein [Deltaproteobacteria bacterium]|nr:saccharopine dehydrogenase NADP-binding domain-containing protein [Deltaproteobacteria bacterium]HPJ93562.1 saccharopine dehydrogenase NADP-binding domain-containing protein [Deltaproteobacteria bacterium]